MSAQKDQKELEEKIDASLEYVHTTLKGSQFEKILSDSKVRDLIKNIILQKSKILLDFPKEEREANLGATVFCATNKLRDYYTDLENLDKNINKIREGISSHINLIIDSFKQEIDTTLFSFLPESINVNIDFLGAISSGKSTLLHDLVWEHTGGVTPFQFIPKESLVKLREEVQKLPPHLDPLQEPDKFKNFFSLLATLPNINHSQITISLPLFSFEKSINLKFLEHDPHPNIESLFHSHSGINFPKSKGTYNFCFLMVDSTNPNSIETVVNRFINLVNTVKKAKRLDGIVIIKSKSDKGSKITDEDISKLQEDLQFHLDLLGAKPISTVVVRYPSSGPMKTQEVNEALKNLLTEKIESRARREFKKITKIK